MTNLASLTFNDTSTANWTATATTTGLANPLGNSNSYKKTLTLGTSIANSSAGGSDELIAEVITIASSSTATINLSSFTDTVNQTSVGFARVKFWRFQLLSTTDDSTNGTACTSITIGNAGSHPFLFNLGGTTPTVTVYNGGLWEYGDTTAAGFTVTSGTNNNILITNNDSSHAAGVAVFIVGGTT